MNAKKFYALVSLLTVFAVILGACATSQVYAQPVEVGTETLYPSDTPVLTETPLPQMTATITATYTSVPTLTATWTHTPTSTTTPTLVPSENPLIIVLEKEQAGMSISTFLQEILPLVKDSKYKVVTFEGMFSVKYPLIFLFNQLEVHRVVDPDLLKAFDLLDNEKFPAVLGVITYNNAGVIQNTLDVIKLRITHGWQVASNTERNVPFTTRMAKPADVAYDVSASLAFISAPKNIGVDCNVLVFPDGAGADYPGIDKIIQDNSGNKILYTVGFAYVYNVPDMPTDTTRTPKFYRGLLATYENKNEIKLFFKP
jgi:hypothetical protein